MPIAPIASHSVRYTDSVMALSVFSRCGWMLPLRYSSLWGPGSGCSWLFPATTLSQITAIGENWGLMLTYDSLSHVNLHFWLEHSFISRGWGSKLKGYNLCTLLHCMIRNHTSCWILGSSLMTLVHSMQSKLLEQLAGFISQVLNEMVWLRGGY